MSAKKTVKSSPPQQAPDVQHQFIVLATKHMGKIGKQLEQGQGDKEEHHRVLEVIAKDIGKAIKQIRARKSGMPDGDPTWCYNNVYVPCVTSGGSNCYQQYLTCCAS